MITNKELAFAAWGLSHAALSGLLQLKRVAKVDDSAELLTDDAIDAVRVLVRHLNNKVEKAEA